MLSDPVTEPFSTKNLLKFPTLSNDYDSAWHGFQFEGKLQNTVFRIPEAKEPSLPSLELGVFRPDEEHLSAPSLVSFDEPTSQESSHAPSEDGHPPADLEQSVEEDVWQLQDLLNGRRRTRLLNWDQFRDPNREEPRTTSLAEAGAEVFDSVLQKVSAADFAVAILEADYFLTALLDLSAGQSSALFAWDQQMQCFMSDIRTATISGYSPHTVQQLVDKLKTMGQQMIMIRQSYQNCINRAGTLPSNHIALYTTMNSCANAIDEYLEAHKMEITSLLQLQNHLTRPSSLISLCNDLLTTARSAATDTELLNAVLRVTAHFRTAYPDFDQVLREIVSAVAISVVANIGRLIGLPNYGGNASLDTLALGSDTDSQVLHWLSPECHDLAREAHITLSLLSKIAPEKIPSATTSIQIGYTWQQIHKLSTQALEHESHVKSVIFESGPSHISADLVPRPDGSVSLFNHQESAVPYYPDPDINNIVTQLSKLTAQDDVHKASIVCLATSEAQHHSFEPEYKQALDWSITPIVQAQHRLLSYIALEHLFVDCQLLQHLRLQQQIHFLGSSQFALQLSTSLFNSDQAVYDGRRHTGGATGLGLQARDTWPPATSELRLVLMGILSDAITNPKHRALEDTMSFAIRELSEDALERCRDVNSIHALDFLRIQYRPPNQVIEAIITPECLEKYDHIFQYLLNLSRVHKAAEALLRNACPKHGASSKKDHLFRIEVHRFVSALAAHGHQVAIQLPWSRLENKILTVKRHAEAGNYESTLAHGVSLKRLQELHHECLEQISRGLFLKHKQHAARLALDDIFNIILRYFAFAMHETNTTYDGSDLTTKRLYDEFQQKVRKFFTLLRSCASDYENSKAELDGINVFDDLLIRLDMSAYWVKA